MLELVLEAVAHGFRPFDQDEDVGMKSFWGSVTRTVFRHLLKFCFSLLQLQLWRSYSPRSAGSSIKVFLPEGIYQ